MDEHEDGPEYSRGRFEGNILARLTGIELTCGDIKTWLQQQEARLRDVEREQSKVKGIAIAVGAVAGILSSVISRIFKW